MDDEVLFLKGASISLVMALAGIIGGLFYGYENNFILVLVAMPLIYMGFWMVVFVIFITVGCIINPWME